MFGNIGGKIKVLAQVICCVGIIVSIVAAVKFFEENPVKSALVLILGILLSWIGNFVLYGFGQLVENSDKIVEFCECDLSEYARFGIDYTQEHSKSKWKCKKCGSMVSEEYDHCPFCEFIDKE